MGNPAQNKAGYRGADGGESELLRTIRRDASKAKRSRGQNAGQTNRPQEPSDEKISQLEKQVLLLTQENAGLRTRVSKLETATRIYEHRMNNYLHLDARLRQLEEGRGKLMDYYNAEFNRITADGQSRIQDAINQANQVAHIQHPIWNIPTHIPWQPRIPSFRLPHYAPVSDITANLDFGEASNHSYISRMKESASNIYSGLNSSISKAVNYLKEKISDAYHGIKEFASQKKKAIAVAAAVGAVSLASILGSYCMRQTDITPWAVAQPAPIVYVMPLPGQATQDDATAAGNPVPEQHNVHTVAQGDTLWGIAEDYLNSHNMEATNQSIYSMTDKIAEINGKGKQADHPVGVCSQNGAWNAKNPHCIKPGEEIKVQR